MNYDLLEGFQPYIIDVKNRNIRHWESSNRYFLVNDETQTHSLALVYDGIGILQINNEQHALSRGVLFYVPPGCRLKITTQETATIQFYSILFTYGHVRWGGRTGFWSQMTNQTLLLRYAMDFNEEPTLLKAYLKILEIWNHKEAGYRWYIKLNFLQLLDLIMNMTHETAKYMKPNAELIETALTYIRNHLGEPFDRSKLAAQLSVSEGYLSTLFKQYTGSTPTEYITRLRIDRTKHLLRNTRISIRRVAEEVGYMDPYYFSRLFTKETGMSPREFRNL